MAYYDQFNVTAAYGKASYVGGNTIKVNGV